MEITQRIAIDLGTRYTRIADVDSGEIVEEPTLVAVEYDGEPAAIGAEAAALLEDLPGKYLAEQPMSGGVICNVELFDIYIQKVLKRLRRGRLGLFPPKTHVSVPVGITDMQKSELRSAISSAAVREIVFVEKPLAAALGAGEDVYSPHASLVLSLGAGMAEAAVVYMGRIIAFRSIPTGGGDTVDAEISTQVRKALDVYVGKGSAEKLKKDIGLSGTGSAVVCAKNIMTGLPVLANVDSSRVKSAVNECLSKMADSIRQMLAGLPNELYADVMAGGVMLTGGGSRLSGICDFFRNALGIPVRQDPEPELSVIKGIVRLAEAAEEKKLLFRQTERELEEDDSDNKKAGQSEIF